jgi:2-haloacid dehalogenase
MAVSRTPDRSRGGSVVAAGIKTLVFDVLGTVVDENGSITAEIATAFADVGMDPAGALGLCEAWSRQLTVLIDRVVAGEEPWRSNDDLRRAALHDSMQALEVDGLSAATLEDLALAGHRPRPWPDSPAALRHLAGSFRVVALSNADFAQLVDMFAGGNLVWHCVLSAELVKSYKPDPVVYRLVLDLLDLDPRNTLIVAAHRWDLLAAAGQGLRTAYVSRLGEGVAAQGDEFDIYADGLADLAERLAGSGS